MDLKGRGSTKNKVNDALHFQQSNFSLHSYIVIIVKKPDDIEYLLEY